MKIINTILLATMMIAAGATYFLEANVRGKINQINQLKYKINAEQENIKLLKVEWSYLNTPQRLEKITQNNKKLKTPDIKKIITEKNIPKHFPIRDPFRPIYGKK